MDKDTFKARIFFTHQNGTDFLTLYDREAFEVLNIKKDKPFDAQTIKIGQILTYDGTKYKVTDIKIELKNQTFTFDSPINIKSPTEPSDFNFEVIVTVVDVG